jgi:hypothetical protein
VREYAFEFVTEEQGTKRRIGRGRTKAAAQKDAWRLAHGLSKIGSLTLVSVADVPVEDRLRLPHQMTPEARAAFAKKIGEWVVAQLAPMAALREARAKDCRLDVALAGGERAT